jgi:Kef-type K+ transport system membrane component KefB
MRKSSIMTIFWFVMLIWGFWTWQANANQPVDPLTPIATENTPNQDATKKIPTHHDPAAPVLIYLIIMLAAARIGAEILERMKQPGVLGELIMGVIIGNIILLNSNWNFLEPLRVQHITVDWAKEVDVLARLGVIILLFQVGLESSLHEMKRVGIASFIVAALGVTAPFILGYFVSMFMVKQLPPNIMPSHVHIYVGATLTATSVGITARVLRDLGKLQTDEARIILGAAVIDDIMGLVILAVVSGIVIAGTVSAGTIVWISLKALIFFVGAILIGTKFFNFIGKYFYRFQSPGWKTIILITTAFSFAWLADLIGLAPIVGAFAAGLILEETHFKTMNLDAATMTELMHPMGQFLVPLFFVLMGIQVRLETFAQLDVLSLAAVLTFVAILGKQLCAVGVGKGINRLAVGLGMIPRGEVGLIFASIGRSLGVVTDAIFSAIVIMVIVTTLVTPPVLKWAMERDTRTAELK